MKTNNEILVVNYMGEFVKVKASKIYKDYGIAITKLKDKLYTLTDIKTGLGCGKHFIKFSDAKSFMDHTEEANFKNWFNAIIKVRLNEQYGKAVQRRKDAKL